MPGLVVTHPCRDAVFSALASSIRPVIYASSSLGPLHIFKVKLPMGISRERLRVLPECVSSEGRLSLNLR
jgi:hypothetical protein